MVCGATSIGFPPLWEEYSLRKYILPQDNISLAQAQIYLPMGSLEI